MSCPVWQYGFSSFPGRDKNQIGRLFAKIVLETGHGSLESAKAKLNPSMALHKEEDIITRKKKMWT